MEASPSMVAVLAVEADRDLSRGLEAEEQSIASEVPCLICSAPNVSFESSEYSIYSYKYLAYAALTLVAMPCPSLSDPFTRDINHKFFTYCWQGLV